MAQAGDGPGGAWVVYHQGVLKELPKSLDRRLHSVHDEVAFARSLSPEQRLVIVSRVCRSALAILNLNPRRDKVLALRDPVPETTR